MCITLLLAVVFDLCLVRGPFTKESQTKCQLGVDEQMDGRTIFEQSKKGTGKQTLSSNDVTRYRKGDREKMGQGKHILIERQNRAWAPHVQGESDR